MKQIKVGDVVRSTYDDKFYGEIGIVVINRGHDALVHFKDSKEKGHNGGAGNPTPDGQGWFVPLRCCEIYKKPYKKVSI